MEDVFDVSVIAAAEGLITTEYVCGVNDTLLPAESFAKYPEKVIEYKNGKVTLLGLFMGEVMKLSKGKADPKIANKLMKDELDRN